MRGHIVSTVVFSSKPVLLSKLSIQFLLQSKFSAFTSSQQKAQNSSKMTSMASMGPLPPPPLPSPPPTPPHPHPHLQSQSFDCQPSIRPAFLSLGTPLHYREELSYCEDPTAHTPSFFFLQERVGFSLDTGASCSDPASGVSSPTVWEASHVTHHWLATPPLLTALRSISLLNIFVHLYSTDCLYPHGHQIYMKNRALIQTF